MVSGQRRRLRHRVGATSVIADTTPLITLARIGRLDLLRGLYGCIVIPRAVHQELSLGPPRAKARHSGDEALRAALEAGWIIVKDVDAKATVAELMARLGPGEAEAIALACECGTQAILIDDELGREVAVQCSLTPRRTAELFVQAKADGLIGSVRQALGECERSGYKLAPELVAASLEDAGETSG